MIHSKNKSEPGGKPASRPFALAFLLVSSACFYVAPLPALALNEGDLEEVMTSCQDKLRSTWGRLQYPKNMSVSVQFRLLPDGGYASPVVVSTSGDKSLDIVAINSIDAAVPYQRFRDAPIDVVANFWCGTRSDVTVTARGAAAAHSLAERKIAIHKKYHQNSISIMEDRVLKGEKVLGKDSPKLWESLNFLANEYKVAGLFDKSAATYKRALSIAQKEGGDSCARAARTVVDRGDMELASGNREAAEASFNQVINMQALPPGKELADALKAMAKLLYKDGKVKEGDELYARIRLIKPGPTH